MLELLSPQVGGHTNAGAGVLNRIGSFLASATKSAMFVHGESARTTSKLGAVTSRSIAVKSSTVS
jgi:hypothetical protein